MVLEKGNSMVFLFSYFFNKCFPAVVHSIMIIQPLGCFFQAQLLVLRVQGFWLSHLLGGFSRVHRMLCLRWFILLAFTEVCIKIFHPFCFVFSSATDLSDIWDL